MAPTCGNKAEEECEDGVTSLCPPKVSQQAPICVLNEMPAPQSDILKLASEPLSYTVWVPLVLLLLYLALGEVSLSM